MPLSLLLAALLSAAPADSSPVWNWQEGRVALPGGKAVLDLPLGFRYLDPAQSEKVLVDYWGNPSGEGHLGMVFAPGQLPEGGEDWGVVLSYDDQGHVDDEDAAKTDFDDLLDDMREGADKEGEELRKAGYEGVKLVGWAEPPRYDAAGKRLFWAKDLQFDSTPWRTLNYAVRVLGREGVLEMNAVSKVSDLPRVRAGMQALLPAASFTEGNRYADYDPSRDRLSKLGVAALVAGGVGVAAKAGLLKGLLIALLAAKKFVLVGAVAAFAGVRAWWSARAEKRRRREATFASDLRSGEEA